MELMDLKKKFVVRAFNLFRIEWSYSVSLLPSHYSEWKGTINWLGGEMEREAKRLKEKMEETGFQYVEFYEYKNECNGAMISIGNEGRTLLVQFRGNLHQELTGVLKETLVKLGYDVTYES